MGHSQPWFAVRCLFDHPGRKSDGAEHLYEERITLWRAESFEEAFALAEPEARCYAESNGCVFLDVSDGFHLFCETVGEGAEVFSLMRGSGMSAKHYQQTFCATPSDRMQDGPTFQEANGRGGGFAGA